jgi:hypothetical protein
MKEIYWLFANLSGVSVLTLMRPWLIDCFHLCFSPWIQLSRAKITISISCYELTENYISLLLNLVRRF